MLNDRSSNNNNNNNDKEDQLYYNNFIYSYKTEVTRKNSLSILKYYMNFLNVNTIRELVEGKPQKIIESDIRAYLVYLRNEKKISHNSAVLYLTVIKKFYTVNTDYPFKWNLINMYLGNDDTDTADDENNDDEYESQQDRPYTMEEVKTMFNAAQDIRVKIVISLLSSSGLRHGALNILKLKDLEKIDKYNLYKITAYRNSKKFRYYTYCTPECRNLIDKYLEYRRSKGEDLKDSSPLIREQFSTSDKLKVNNPRHLTSKSIRSMINDVLTKYSSLRKKLSFDYKNNRKKGKNPTMLTHGFRKFFTVECTKAGVYHEIVERLEGHKIPGSRNSYLLFNSQTLLEGTKDCKGYINAIDALTINEENRLQKQLQQVEEQKDYQKYIIDKKIAEKDTQIQVLTSQLNDIAKQIQEINQRTKVDPEITKKIKNGEIDLMKLYFEDNQRKEKQKQKLLDQVKKYNPIS
jgi:integrase